MKTRNTTRREFLATSAGAGALGMLAYSLPLRRAMAAGTLKVRFNGALDSLDPGYNVGGSPDNDVLWCINPALVHFDRKDGKLTWRPTDHVESVTQRDATHIDFKLKPGLMWSNGFGELTAEDVAYSYDRMKTSEWKGFFEAFDKVELQDKYSGTIVLSTPFAPFMVATLCSGTGIILSQKATESVGGRFTTEIPATCGPYNYEWKQKQYVRFTRNADWPGARPYFDDIDCRFVAEDEAAALAYEAGEVAATRITSNAYARYQKQLPPNSKLHTAGALQYMWMGMNTEHPKLKDIRVRQAIQHAVDTDSVNQGAYSGTAEISHGIVCPGLVGKRNASKYSYDPARARALLAEAGVSGLELELKTLNQQERVLAAQIIQANLQAVGIKVTVLPQDSGPFWEMGQESKGETWKDLQMWIMRFGAGADPYEPFQWFVRDQVGVWNWERWSSDEFEDLYKKGLVAGSTAERNTIYLRMQEIMEDTGAYVWLTHEPEVYVHRDDLVVDFAPSGEFQLLYFRDA